MDGTLLYNAHDLEPFLGHEEVEHPLCLQLGGCDPTRVGEAAYLCEGYKQWHSINLNCGCPSNKAKKAGFGAELMLDAVNTGMIVKEMARRVTHTDITVKCRLGVLPGHDSYEELQTFVREVTNAGAKTLIIHARNVVLTGLSPAQNRSIPPLRYEDVHRLVREWPDVKFILNGGLRTFEECEKHLGWNDEGQGEEEREEYPVNGCMIGREAYKNPWLFADADRRFFKKRNPGVTRREAMEGYLEYCQQTAQRIMARNDERDEQIQMKEGHILGARTDNTTLQDDGKRAVNEDEEEEEEEEEDIAHKYKYSKEVKKRGVFSMGDMTKPMHHFFAGCPSGQRQYKNRLEELLLNYARAKEARKAKKEHLWNVGAGAEEDADGESDGQSNIRRNGDHVFDFSLLEREQTGELLVDIISEAVKDTIPDDFLDAVPTHEECC